MRSVWSLGDVRNVILLSEMFGNATARATEPLAGGTLVDDTELDGDEPDVDDVVEDELEAELAGAELADAGVEVDEVPEVAFVSPPGPLPKTR